MTFAAWGALVAGVAFGFWLGVMTLASMLYGGPGRLILALSLSGQDHRNFLAARFETLIAEYRASGGH